MHMKQDIRGNAESFSYWQQTTDHVTLPSDLPSSVDIAVIGGGILGTATCYWLARAGVAPVLFERNRLASGATGRNAGIVSIGPAEAYPAAINRLGPDEARRVLSVTLENKERVHQVIQEEHIACDYREAGHLTFALNSEDMKHCEQSVAALHADGVVTRLLDHDALQHAVQTPLGTAIVGGLFTPATALVHSAKLVQSLARAAQRYGARLHEAQVVRVIPDGKGVNVQTIQGAVHASIVIVATNAWMDELVPEAAQWIMPVRGQALAFEPCEPVFSTGAAVHLTETEEYWQQTPGGSIVLGGCRAVAPHQDRGIRSHQPTPDVQAALEQVFPQLFPSLNKLRVAQRWAGVMALTPDYLPIVDQVKDCPAVWFAGGFCGHGMAIAMRLGQLLAEAVVSGATPEGLRPFRLSRRTLS